MAKSRWLNFKVELSTVVQIYLKTEKTLIAYVKICRLHKFSIEKL